ncbi:MAG: ABC-F family ATP-binding cassette domain-containing protein, partial [Bacteroidales bacterium]|nr:ABC-F family ATP-binding cassette domain-containing protein [Bacteroidales bacterium]
DEPTNHLDMPSKDVLKEAIRAFDGTAIIVSHDREFLDGLVTKVFEFGGGKVREHLGGIYDYLRTKPISSLSQREGSLDGYFEQSKPAQDEKNTAKSNQTPPPSGGAEGWALRKEQQKQLRKAEKAVEESEKKIAKMEQRLKELDALLCDPKNASDMTLVTEYTDTKHALDEEVERWEQFSEELEKLNT